jgi:hypothetical protein
MSEHGNRARRFARMVLHAVWDPQSQFGAEWWAGWWIGWCVMPPFPIADDDARHPEREMRPSQDLGTHDS